MIVTRATQCSLKYLTDHKRQILARVIAEYGRVCNYFITYFWNRGALEDRMDIGKNIIDLPQFTWLSYRLKKIAAQEANAMVKAVRARWADEPEKAGKPLHNGKTMTLNSNSAIVTDSKTPTFDAWVRLSSIGKKICFNIPIKFHRHYHKLAQMGKRAGGLTITPEKIYFFFKINTGPKKQDHAGPDIGIDLGINSLLSVSTGNQYDCNIKNKIDALNKKKKGSKGRRKARRALNHAIDETVKRMFEYENPRTVIVENLKNLNKNTKKKKKLSKKIRKQIGVWNYRYVLIRIQQRSEINRAYFRSVAPYWTSVTCSACGNFDRKQRSGTKFLCSGCGHQSDADINAAVNIRDRCLRGKYRPPRRKV